MSNTKNKILKITAEIIYLFLIFFFCYTAINKLINIESFRTNLIKTSLFNIELANYFSIAVIIFEIVIVLLLIFYKKIGLFCFALTIGFFTIYISYLRFKGLYEVCGCGGILNGLKYKYHLMINLSLIFSSFYSLLIFKKLTNEK